MRLRSTQIPSGLLRAGFAALLVLTGCAGDDPAATSDGSAGGDTAVADGATPDDSSTDAAATDANAGEPSGTDAGGGDAIGGADTGATDTGTADTGATDAGTDAGATDTGADTGVPYDGPTFYEHVEPILQANCQTCHIYGGVGPFELVDYAMVSALAGTIAEATGNRIMPPWGAHDTEECEPLHPWRADMRLTDEEIATLAEWAEAGAPAGDPEKAPPSVAPPPPPVLEDPELVLTPATYTVDGHDDIFRCFVLDPGFEKTHWINGLAFKPGNGKVAHHALLFMDTKGESKGRADETGGFDCFGGAGSGDQLIGAWAPGGLPMLLPPDTGIPVEPGSLLVLQMHYHPTGTGPEQDATAIALKLLDEEPASYALAALIGNDNHAEPGGDGLQPGPNDPESGPAFVIPPGAKGHTESMVYTVPPVVGSMELPVFRIFAVASHMHYVGTDMVINLKRKPAGVAACPDGELGPLVACISTNCDGLSGGELQDCAIDHCVADYLALSTACSQCTLANAKSGDVAEIQAACEKIDELEGPPQADQECLLQTPQWNFEWQRFYEYDLPVDELPTVRPGDRLEFRCTYDNSMDNPFVAEALEYQGLDAPIEVKLGETTLDEMCLVALQLIYPAPAKQ